MKVVFVIKENDELRPYGNAWEVEEEIPRVGEMVCCETDSPSSVYRRVEDVRWFFVKGHSTSANDEGKFQRVSAQVLLSDPVVGELMAGPLYTAPTTPQEEEQDESAAPQPTGVSRKTAPECAS